MFTSQAMNDVMSMASQRTAFPLGYNPMLTNSSVVAGRSILQNMNNDDSVRLTKGEKQALKRMISKEGTASSKKGLFSRKKSNK